MSTSLREIADWMDPDRPAQRLFGKGPPFEPNRPQPYDGSTVMLGKATVDIDDPWGPPNPPDPPKRAPST